MAQLPEIYGMDKKNIILDRLSEGETLTSICKTPGMPTPAAVLKWTRVDPDGFGKHYAMAREVGYTVMADQIIDEAANPRRGVKKKTKADGSREIEEGDAVDRSRLHVDTLKWLMSKALPKIYGARQDDSPSEITIKIEGGLPE